MKRFILTGAPGAGKTSILRALEAGGYAVVPEAATDVMTARLALAEPEPWTDPLFIDRIAALQRQRREAPVRPGVTVQVHDRSAVCTLALARYLGHPVPPLLEQEVAWAAGGGSFDRRVFVVRLLGFIEPTAVRRISYDESQAFERIHEEEYRRLGFDLVDVPAGTVAERAAAIARQARTICLNAGVKAAPLLGACTVDEAVPGKKPPLIYRTLPTNVTVGTISPPKGSSNIHS